MNTIIKGITGMTALTDQVIATDFLISVKSAVRNYAIAVTEVTSSDLRNALKVQLNNAIETHEIITRYMMDRGYYHPYNLSDQFNEDMKVTETALNLVG